MGWGQSLLAPNSKGEFVEESIETCEDTKFHVYWYYAWLLSYVSSMRRRIIIWTNGGNLVVHRLLST